MLAPGFMNSVYEIVKKHRRGTKKKDTSEITVPKSYEENSSFLPTDISSEEEPHTQ